MHLISARNLKIAVSHQYPDLEENIKIICKNIQEANWSHLLELQEVYPSAEAVGNFTVINIKGNKYRLILSIDYEKQVAYFKYLLTHSEYDKEQWKNDYYY
jgi:mRNA interferase HigB